MNTYRVSNIFRCGPKQIVFFTLLLIGTALCYWYYLNSYRRYNPYILRHLPETSVHLYNSFSNSHLEDLQSNIPFLTVHYLWCSSGTGNVFEHRHYLGIMSILKQLHPDQIFFHYDVFPLSDNSVVNWIKDLKRDVAILNFKPAMFADNVCNANMREVKMDGIFVGSDIIVTNLNRASIISKIAFCPKPKYSCNINNIYPPSRKLVLTSSASLKSVDNFRVINCPSLRQITSQNERVLPECVFTDSHSKVRDIHQGYKNIHNLMRTVLYGHPERVQPISSSSLIPIHGHIVSETFTIKVYISILSAVTSGQFKTIFYHGTELPYGTNWNKLKESVAEIHFVEVDSETFPNTRASLHQYSFYILLQYGGIIFTENVIWQKKVPRELLKFDTVGVMHPFETKIFDLNVLMAKPGSLFLRSILPFSQQLGSQSNELINYASYHIYELYPKYVYMNSNLIDFLTCATVCTVNRDALAIVDSKSIITDEDSYHKIFTEVISKAI